MVLVIRTKKERLYQLVLDLLQIVLKSKNMVTKLEKSLDIQLGPSTVSGLVDSKDYYVRKISDDKFSLSEVGVGNTNPKHFFDRDMVVDIKSIGEGTFNYKPIVVTVDGVTGIDSALVRVFSVKFNQYSGEVLTLLI